MPSKADRFGFKVLFTISCSTTTSSNVCLDRSPPDRKSSFQYHTLNLTGFALPSISSHRQQRQTWCWLPLSAAPSPRSPALSFPSLATSLLLLACQLSSPWNPLHHLLPISFSTYSPHPLLCLQHLPAPPGAHAGHFTAASVAPAPLPLWPSDASCKKCQALLGSCSVSTFQLSDTLCRVAPIHATHPQLFGQLSSTLTGFNFPNLFRLPKCPLNSLG